VPSLLGRLNAAIPPSRVARRLAGQSVLFAIGEGTFNTGSAVFFVEVTGLSAAQVGLGLTIGGLVSFAAAYPAGKLVDRYGPKRLWWMGTLASAALFCVWPFLHGMLMYVAMRIVGSLIGQLGQAAWMPYTLDVLPQEDRVRSQAFSYSAINLGFTLGAVLGGVALAFNDISIVRALPWVSAGLGLINAFFIWRLPDAEHDRRAAAARSTVAALEKAVKDTSASPLRNRGFLAVSFLDGIIGSHQVLLNTVIPLWLVQRTDAPHVLLAWLFGTNTVMCIFLPQVTSRGVRDIPTAVRAIWKSAFFFTLSCVIVLFTHDTLGGLTIFLVWLGHATVTMSELFNAGGRWAFMSQLFDPERRGEYNGAADLASTLGSVWAPALFTFLAMDLGAGGWLTMAALIVLSAAFTGPAARSAERFLAARTVPAPA